MWLYLGVGIGALVIVAVVATVVMVNKNNKKNTKLIVKQKSLLPCSSTPRPQPLPRNPNNRIHVSKQQSSPAPRSMLGRSNGKVNGSEMRNRSSDRRYQQPSNSRR